MQRKREGEKEKKIMMSDSTREGRFASGQSAATATATGGYERRTVFPDGAGDPLERVIPALAAEHLRHVESDREARRAPEAPLLQPLDHHPVAVRAREQRAKAASKNKHTRRESILAI